MINAVAARKGLPRAARMIDRAITTSASTQANVESADNTTATFMNSSFKDIEIDGFNV
jgi:hypothetical protein